MNKFFSNDRQVILKSAAAGIGIITFLYLMLSLNTDSIILWILATCGLLAVYWFIPTCFSRNRPVEKREIKHFIPEGIEMNKPATPEYQYFNTDGEAIKKLSDKEVIIAIILGLIINILFIFLIYPKLIQLLIGSYNSYHNIFVGTLITLTVITPYLTHHIYHFILNRPMNIPLTLKLTNTSFHKHKDNGNRSQSYNYATNPIYSYMPCNQYHYRHK